MKQQKLKPVGLFLLGCILLIFALFLFFHTPDHKFEVLCDELFIKELSEDGLSLHYTLASPEKYGIDNGVNTLSSYDKTKSEADYRALLSLVQELENIDPDSLSDDNRRTYEILYTYAQNECLAYEYLYYDEPLSPTHGMQNQLPVLLAEYALRNKADIENYFCLLQSVPIYFQGLSDFEEEKSAEGLFMSDEAAKQTLLQCTSIITKEDLAEGTHFLQTSFAERLARLVEEEIITPDEMEAYCTTNTGILSESVLPAYQGLAHSITSLVGSGTNEKGLCYYPDGKKYYELLVRRQTGCSKNIDEIMSDIQTAFLGDYNAFAELACSTMTTEKNIFSLSEPDKMLKDLEKSIQEDFPAYPGVKEDEMPFYTIKKVNESMEEYLSPAFYLTPPIDDVSENVIYINYGQTPDNLELYTTLAHEGYPGHLYQSVYSALAFEEAGTHPIRSLLHFGGYVEGYATYAELYSYEYAAKFGQKEYCELVRLNRQIHLALYSMLDISIHYYGATLEDTCETLRAFGIDDRNTAGEIYDYIVNSPGNYLQYYVGYLEIMECRELARVKWKNNYSDYNFHEFLMNFGPADFETIKDEIRTYKAPDVPETTASALHKPNSMICYLKPCITPCRPSQSLQCGWCQDDPHQAKEIPLHRI